MAAPRVWGGGIVASGTTGGGMPLVASASGDANLRAAVCTTDMHTRAIVRDGARS